LVFRDGDDLFIQSRDEKPLARYYPELVLELKRQLPKRCVLDGEIVIARADRLDFEALQLRLHPAASRIRKLAVEIPASMVFFDLLCLGARDLRDEPFHERRAALESALKKAVPPLHLSPATTRRETAADWFRRFEGAGLDGVVAKSPSGRYESNKRVMLKVKHERDCDCVVAGFRWHKQGEGAAIGSLLLGLYDEAGELQHVGVCSSFTAEKRREMASILEPYRMPIERHPWRDWGSDGEDVGASTHRRPGSSSRWSRGKDLSWEPLRPKLVLQVAYDHMQGTRFRHSAQFRRWRKDKRPRDCTFAQLEMVPPHELAAIFRQRH
jgi:ATP-dependent DNA ligase